MPTTPKPKYELELWVNGVQVGDITRLAKNRSFSLRRNNAEELSFTMDLGAFEAYCEAAGSEPSEMLEAYVTDVRVRRNGAYLFGVQVVDMVYDLNEGGTSLSVKCTGFLDLFRDRYVTKSYDATEATSIARDLLATTQTDHGSFGVTNGAEQYNTGVLRDRNYVDQNVKDGLVNLTSLIDGNFDFKFNYDRSFETYEQIGSNRTGYKFTYPYNISSISVPHTGLNTFNYIIALGSGFGEETLRSVVSDMPSRLNYGTRMRVVSFNSVSEQATLDQNALAVLAQQKDILELPKLKTSGVFCDLNIIGIGDRIPVEIQDHPAIPLNGTYRIEQIECTLDDNDAEEIDLTVDNYGL